MAFKTRVLEAIRQLEELVGADAANSLRLEVSTETDERKLFLMLQTIREVIAKESGSKAEFTYSDKDGKLRKAASIEEAMQNISGAGNIK